MHHPGTLRLGCQAHWWAVAALVLQLMYTRLPVMHLLV